MPPKIQFCKHCMRSQATRPRKLCWTCFKDRSIRNLYPTLPGSPNAEPSEEQVDAMLSEAMKKSCAEPVVLLVERNGDKWHVIERKPGVISAKLLAEFDREQDADKMVAGMLSVMGSDLVNMRGRNRR